MNKEKSKHDIHSSTDTTVAVVTVKDSLSLIQFASNRTKKKTLYV